MTFTCLLRQIYGIIALVWTVWINTSLQTSRHGPSRCLFYSASFRHLLNLILTSSASGNVLKPSLDLVLFTSQLSRSLGFRGTLLLFGNYYVTVAILRAVTPAFGKLAAVEARLEGEYRAGMGRVGREGEEVAYVPSPTLVWTLF